MAAESWTLFLPSRFLSSFIKVSFLIRWACSGITQDFLVRAEETVLNSAVGAANTKDVVVTDLEAWLHARGAHSQLRIVPWVTVNSSHSTPSGGEQEIATVEYGMATVTNVERGQVLMKMPVSTWIVSDNSFVNGRRWKGQGPTAAPEVDFAKSNAWDVPLALFLLQQRSLANASAFAPFIRSLPSHVPSGLSFLRQEIDEIQYKPTVQRILDYVDVYLRSAYQELFNSAMLPPGLDSFEDYKWAASVVWSRSFNVQCTLAHIKDALEDPDNDPLANGGSSFINIMIPFLDMINHDSDPDLSWSIDGAEMKLTATTTRPVGSAVTINYGEHTNDELLMTYGFILYPNPLDRGVLFDDLQDMIYWYYSTYAFHGKEAISPEAEARERDFFGGPARQVTERALASVTQLAPETGADAMSSLERFSVWLHGTLDPHLLAALTALGYAHSHSTAGENAESIINKIAYGRIASESVRYSHVNTTTCRDIDGSIQRYLRFATQVIRRRIEELLWSFGTSAWEDKMLLEGAEDVRAGRCPGPQSEEVGEEEEVEEEEEEEEEEGGAGDKCAWAEPLSPNMELIVKFRLTKKRLLKSAFDRMEDTCSEPEREERRFRIAMKGREMKKRR